MAEPTYRFRIAVSRSDLPEFEFELELGSDSEGIPASAARAPDYPLALVVRRFDAMIEQRSQFQAVCEQYGGGPKWTGKDNLPRKARRQIARRLAKGKA